MCEPAFTCVSQYLCEEDTSAFEIKKKNKENKHLLSLAYFVCVDTQQLINFINKI